MFRRAGIKVQTFVPLDGPEGEWLPIESWTWWKDEIQQVADALTGSQGPWLIRLEKHVWLTWIAVDEQQLEILAKFFERTRQSFGLDELYFDHSDVTFTVARSKEK
jgi:hypothetical protein